MIINKEEVEKAAAAFIIKEHLDGYSDMYYRETFKAGVEFSEEYVQKHVQDIIIENQGLKLYKDNEENRFKELAVEFAEWILQHKNPSFGIIGGYKSPNRWMDAIQGNRIDYTTEELYNMFLKERK